MHKRNELTRKQIGKVINEMFIQEFFSDLWRPGVLQSMGLQRVGHDWATELNWTGSLEDFSEFSHILVHLHLSRVAHAGCKKMWSPLLTFIVVPIKINIFNIMIKTSTSEEDYFSTRLELCQSYLTRFN